jgi:hypothetical protein
MTNHIQHSTNQASHHSLTALTEKRRRWVAANQENDFEDGIRRLLTDLYPHNAHFIYELFQNAEDAGATVVRFTLTNDNLEFEHNGGRLFSLPDVESITSIGTSTKRDDNTSIGKFGVGFKAVFAYTDTPEVHSGEFHFRIEDLVVPVQVPMSQTTAGGETRFVFPFNHSKKTKIAAFEEIKKGLLAQGANTLLFLNKIRKIEYLLPDGSLGFLECKTEDNEHKNTDAAIIEILAQASDENRPKTEHFLRYFKEVDVETTDNGNAKNTTTGAKRTWKRCRVAIAYALEKNKGVDDSAEEKATKKNRKNVKMKNKKTHAESEWKIVSPAAGGSVAIYFPAEKETSKLHFHMHAPFASTVARDSVRDCDENKKLRDAITELVVESLHDIKERNMLTVHFLGVLPNADDELSEFYEPIREKIVEAFQNEPLVPTKSGEHKKAGELFTGPKAISDVIDDNALSMMTGCAPPLWAANAPVARREEKFLATLEIDTFGFEDLHEVFAGNTPNTNGFDDDFDEVKYKKEIEKWIAKQGDKGLVKFYLLLNEKHEHLSFEKTDLALVRVESNGKHVAPSAAFFPLRENSKAARGTYFVKRELYKGKDGSNVKAFLEKIGVTVLDEEEKRKQKVEKALRKYEPDERVNKNIADDDHLKDIRLFVSYWKEVGDNALEIFGGKIFKATDDMFAFYEPKNLFLDSPYAETHLREVAKIHEKHELWNGYANDNDLDKNDFIEFAKAVGIMHNLKVEEITEGYQIISAEWLTSSGKGMNAKRNRERMMEIDKSEKREIAKFWNNQTYAHGGQEWTIDDLRRYVAEKSVFASRLLWNALIQAPPKAKKSFYYSQARHREHPRHYESLLVANLKALPWIPDREGNFHFPQEMSRKMLPESFAFNETNGLLTAIGFGEKEQKESADYEIKKKILDELGFSSFGDAKEMAEMWQLAKKEGMDISQFKGLLVSRTQKNETPDKQSKESHDKVSNTERETPQIAASESLDPIVRDVLSRAKRIKEREAMQDDTADITAGDTDSDAEDEDDYTPRVTDYKKKIEREKDKAAENIAVVERKAELVEIINNTPKYSFQWFQSLIKLEILENGEDEKNDRGITIEFGKMVRDKESVCTLILSNPSRFIPPHVEELSGIRLDISMRGGTEHALTIEAVSVKEFVLTAKIKGDEIKKLDEVTAQLDKFERARIKVESPAFLLQALLACYDKLSPEKQMRGTGGAQFDDGVNLRDTLPANISFIFGPPGTGKTTHLAKEILLPFMRMNKRANMPARVLVLAPTNKAADVLTARIMEKAEPNTDFYQDWLVRFGTTNDDRIEKAKIRFFRFFCGQLGKTC